MNTEEKYLLEDLDELSRVRPVDLRLGIETLKENFKKILSNKKRSKQKILKLVLKLEEKIINEVEKDQLLLINQIKSKIKEEL